jgi:hypothetical protein
VSAYAAQKSLMAIKNDQSNPDVPQRRVAEPMTASTTIIGNSDLGQNFPGLSAQAGLRDD